MAAVYARLIRTGTKRNGRVMTIDDVPERIRAEVAALLEPDGETA